MGAFDCDCIENLMGRFEEEQKTERIQNAINHIKTAVDIDPWAMEIAVEAMEKELKNSTQPKPEEKDHQEQGELAELGSKTGETCADAISRQQAIDGVKMLHDVAWKNWREPTLSANVILDMIRELPSVQPENTERTAKTEQNVPNDDLISREMAIDALSTPHGILYPIRTVEELSSAQPLIRTEMSSADDMISRQAAIDAILAVTGNSSVRELYEHVQEHELSEMWSGGVNAAIDIIIALPSVQPEAKTNANGDWVILNKGKILKAGMEGREVDFRIGGRLFAIREKAQ